MSGRERLSYLIPEKMVNSRFSNEFKIFPGTLSTGVGFGIAFIAEGSVVRYVVGGSLIVAGVIGNSLVARRADKIEDRLREIKERLKREER